MTDEPAGLPPGVALSLTEVLRVMEALTSARLELARAGAGLGIRDELDTVLRILGDHLRSEGGGRG